jgi:hypothetical protein
LWLIFQRIDCFLPREATNQRACDGAVPGAAAMRGATGAFSSEVDTGSREENASKQEIEPRSDSIGTEKALEAAQQSCSGRVDAAPSPEPPWQIPSRARRFCLGHVVDPGGAPGLAAQQPRQGHPSAAPQPEALDRLIAIDRTGRQVTAVVSDQRRQGMPVNPDHRAPGIARQAHNCGGAVRAER